MPSRSVRLLAAIAVLVFSALQTTPLAAQDEKARPNVLFIAIDDLNDWIGCLEGHPQVKTPNIDKLASRGVLFTNAQCQSPVCAASRISMLTGRLPSSTGFYGLNPSRFREHEHMKDAVTIPQCFAKSGYQTAGIGKIYHSGFYLSEFQVKGKGGGFGPSAPGGKINYKIGHPLWDWGPVDRPMPDTKLAKWTADRLKKKAQKPFFLACGFYRPHVPMYAHSKYFAQYPELEKIKLPETRDDDRDDLPKAAHRVTEGLPAPRHEWFIKNKADMQWQKAVKAYLACITFVDENVGTVLDALEKSPYFENTIVVLYSDHGFHLGEKQRWAKRSIWDESAKVPLIIAGPGIPKGVKCNKPVNLLDIYPTIIELCNLQKVEKLDGHSMVPLLKDANADWKHAALTMWFPNNTAVRSEHYRYIQYDDGGKELYDHRTDPNEFKNLAGEESMQKMIAEHQAHLPKTFHPPVPGSQDSGWWNNPKKRRRK